MNASLLFKWCVEIALADGSVHRGMEYEGDEGRAAAIARATAILEGMKAGEEWITLDALSTFPAFRAAAIVKVGAHLETELESDVEPRASEPPEASRRPRWRPSRR